MKLLILILSFFLIAWTYTTPLGIRVTATQRTIHQYEQFWGSWSNIEWQRIDWIFSMLKAAYNSPAEPNHLRIRIHPWSWKCLDEVPDSMEMIVLPYGCIDGLFYPETNLIVIHLGDDGAIGPYAWYLTALDYEMGHYFLRSIGDPCWALEFYKDCPSHYISIWEIGGI